MATLKTVGDYIAECRRLLQDKNAPYRYSDIDIVRGLNIGMLEARRTRADLFLSGATLSVPDYATDPVDPAQVVVMEDYYRQSFVYYVVGRMQLADNEETTDARASALMNKFVGQLLTPQS